MTYKIPIYLPDFHPYLEHKRAEIPNNVIDSEHIMYT